MMLVTCQSAEFCILPLLSMQEMKVFLNRRAMSTIVLPASIAITQDSRQQGPFSGQAVMNVGYIVYSLYHNDVPGTTGSTSTAVMTEGSNSTGSIGSW